MSPDLTGHLTPQVQPSVLGMGYGMGTRATIPVTAAFTDVVFTTEKNRYILPLIM